MLKIRLQRIGRKNEPSFRLVTTESRRGPKSGKNIEILGSYDPRRSTTAIKGARVEYWISKGALVSDTVHNLLVKENIIKGKKIDVSSKKKVKKGAEESKGAIGLPHEGEAKIADESPKKEETKTEEKAKDKDAPKKKEEKNAIKSESTPESPTAEETKKEEVKEEDKN
jgi:small subunit ribosomal protein S16